MYLSELFKVVTDAMDMHISDNVDAAVEDLHQALSVELATAYMEERGYEVGEGFKFVKVAEKNDNSKIYDAIIGMEEE